MELGFILLKQILLMFMIMMFGVMLYKSSKVTNQGAKELGSMLLYFIGPMTIIRAYSTDFSWLKAHQLLLTFALAIISVSVGIIISTFLFRHKKIDAFVTTFSNAGFMGIPLVQAILGLQAVLYLSAFMAVATIAMWTYGVYVLSGRQEGTDIKKILANPVILSVFVGLIIYFGQIPLPGFAMEVMTTISYINSPLAMIVLGVYLAQVPWISLFNQKDIYRTSMVRLVLVPLIVGFMLVLIPNGFYEVKMTVMIATSAPAAFNTAILAQQYHQDVGVAVRYVCLSTLLSLITMPIILTLMAMVWA